MREPESLQQIDRTFVRYRGRKLSYFSGCDYFRLASHPKVVAALAEGASRYGISVAASRITSGNHRLYGEIEERLVEFFGAPNVLFVSSGYLTNLIVAQALSGQFSHVLMDERSHASLQDAARLMECPVLCFKHRNPEDLTRCANRCGPGSRVILLTDGLFAHDGSTAPLRDYFEVLPADAVTLVDDAHGAGTVGETGQGSLEYCGIGRERVIQTITLSKAFGVYGGAILGSKRLREQIFNRSAMFTGSTPMPLALVKAALVAIDLVANEGIRKRLRQNSATVKATLESSGFSSRRTPGPIVGLLPPDSAAARRFERVLLQNEIFPPAIRYPTASAQPSFRFAISSEHTQVQLQHLGQAMLKAGLAGW